MVFLLLESEFNLRLENLNEQGFGHLVTIDLLEGNLRTNFEGEEQEVNVEGLIGQQLLG